MKTIKKEWSSLKALEDKDIILVVGMPGSGKSTLLRTYYNDGYYIFDNFLKTSDYFEQLTSLKNTLRRKFILSDIALCDISFFHHMIDKITSAFPDVKVGAILYENNPHNCIINITNRSLNRGDKFETIDQKRVALVGKLDTTIPNNARPAYTVEIEKILGMYSKYIPSNYSTVDSITIPVYAA